MTESDERAELRAVMIVEGMGLRDVSPGSRARSASDCEYRR